MSTRRARWRSGSRFGVPPLVRFRRPVVHSFSACWPAAIKPDGDAAMAGTSSGCLLGYGVVPTAVRSDNRVSLFRPPTSAPVGAGLVVPLKDWVDHRPGGFHRILTSEECTIAG